MCSVFAFYSHSSQSGFMPKNVYYIFFAVFGPLSINSSDFTSSEMSWQLLDDVL